MSPLRYNVLAIWISACVCVLCGCGGDKVETAGDPVLSPPTIDSTVLGMYPDLRLADSLLNNSYEDKAHTIYARLYGSQAELSDPEKRTLLLRLALTAVWKVSEAGDSAYQAVADLLRRYEVMAGSTEQVSLLESAELEVALGCLAIFDSYDEAHTHFQKARSVCVTPGAVDATNAQRLLSRIGRMYLFTMSWAGEAVRMFEDERTLLDSYAYPAGEVFQRRAERFSPVMPVRRLRIRTTGA